MTVSEDRSHLASENNFFQNHIRLAEYRKSETFKMLAQQRLPVHIEYLQPHLTIPESKASPLALLAATCSSIGKPDHPKPDHEKKDTKATLSSLSSNNNNKIRENIDNKPSFEPYKLEKKTNGSASPPSITQTNSISTSKASIMSTFEDDKFRSRMEHGKILKDAKDMMHQHNMRHIPPSPPFGYLQPRVPMMPNMHHHAGHEHHHGHGECTQCKTHRPHSEPLALSRQPLPPQPLPAPCACAMCMRSESKCHYQQPGGPLLSLYPPSPYKQSPPMINTCRDPNCTNCSKPASSIQNFLHPALIHQCTHGSLPNKPIFPPPILPSHTSTHEHPSKTNPKPFVCNWVSEGKHCGSAYPTSEELFQHLRTHTSLQQQQQNECETLIPQSTRLPGNPQNTCKIHGCPCSNSNNARKPSPRASVPGYAYSPLGGNTIRYGPYQRPVPSGGSTSYNYPPHGFHY